MRAIIVDDEPLMMHKFARLSAGIKDLNLTGQFETPELALSYMKTDPVDIAFLDVEMPVMNGITLAENLRDIRPDLIIVFITAFDEYISDFNAIGGDYYLVKPYTREVIELMMEKIRMLAIRQHKDIYIQTFGRFIVKKDNIPVNLTGKAKEILALIVIKHGKEISNEEIYGIVWENRPYSNVNMTVFYNALRRLKTALNSAGIGDLLISTARGQMVNTDLFDCDYYAWKEQKMELRDRFEGEFLSEYTWGESILADILMKEYGI